MAAEQNLVPICRNVPLVNDEVSETVEQFLVQMSTLNERVSLQEFVHVSILDDDSEWWLSIAQYHYVSSFSCTDAFIGIEQSFYTVHESDMTLSVCITSSAVLERNVEIDISLLSGTAEGEYYHSSTVLHCA